MPWDIEPLPTPRPVFGATEETILARDSSGENSDNSSRSGRGSFDYRTGDRETPLPDTIKSPWGLGTPRSRPGDNRPPDTPPPPSQDVRPPNSPVESRQVSFRGEGIEHLDSSVHDLASVMPPFVPWTSASAREAARKAIAVCDALKKSLTELPDEKLVVRGELSAEVLTQLPWEAIAVVLGIKAGDKRLNDLVSRITEFAAVVAESEADTDVSSDLEGIVGSYKDALDGVLRIQEALVNSLNSHGRR